MFWGPGGLAAAPSGEGGGGRGAVPGGVLCPLRPEGFSPPPLPQEGRGGPGVPVAPSPSRQGGACWERQPLANLACHGDEAGAIREARKL